MGKGYLTIELFVGDHVLPVKNAAVIIKDVNGRIIYELTTNENGLTEKIPLDAPDKELMLDPNNTSPLFSKYDVEVPNVGGYRKVVIHGVQIFDGIASVLPIQMHPEIPGDTQNTDNIYIPPEHGIDLDRELSNNSTSSRYNSQTVSASENVLANEVCIPEYITVHLGSPNAAARNVRVPFKDYIKNVASSEIYPIWEEAAIYANIHVQISFVLNRVYTVWYRSRDKDFDITNSTAFDQCFVEGRNIFENISRIVDNIFGKFIRRQGRREPYFASYCNGTTSLCDGLSQWGSQSLALKGYTPIEILKYYYPADIQIVESANFTASYVGAYSGVPLKEGSSGEDVRKMQLYLNRISGNFYIPSIPNPNGIFDSCTKATVIEFQKINYLTPDGIVGSSTWYAIIKVYVAVKELAELTSEGERIGIGETPPTVTLQLNSRGECVVELQFLLNFVAEFYPSISFVIENGVFRSDTKRGVIEFQKEFGLTQDGVVGPTTWRKLYDVYRTALDIIITPPIIKPQVPSYPGSSLKLGSRGSDVLLMQNYLNAIAKIHFSIPAIKADGVFGTATQTSVMMFQRQFGLTVDGIIGLITWNKIVEIYNKLDSTPSFTFPGISLRIGSRGNDVLLMQECLRKISVFFPDISTLTTDGVFGAGTQAAVIAFQLLFGLTPDGVIGKNTWHKIVNIHNNLPSNVPPQYPGTSLKIGSRGNDVLVMQKYLAEFMKKYYPHIPALISDGILGEKTKESVITFQKKFGLNADGIIGKNTWNKIVSVYNTFMMNSDTLSVYSISSAGHKNNDLSKYALLALCMYGNIRI